MSIIVALVTCHHHVRIKILLSWLYLNFDISDVSLTRGGVGVSLTAANLQKRSPTEYGLDLTAATNIGGNYVLTVSSSDITDRATNTTPRRRSTESATMSLRFW